MLLFGPDFFLTLFFARFFGRIFFPIFWADFFFAYFSAPFFSAPIFWPIFRPGFSLRGFFATMHRTEDHEYDPPDDRWTYVQS